MAAAQTPPVSRPELRPRPREAISREVRPSPLPAGADWKRPHQPERGGRAGAREEGPERVGGATRGGALWLRGDWLLKLGPSPAGPRDSRDPHREGKKKTLSLKWKTWPFGPRLSELQCWKRIQVLGCRFEWFPLLNIDPETKNKQRSFTAFECLCVPGTMCC